MRRLRTFLALDAQRRRLFLGAFRRLRTARRALREQPFRDLLPVAGAPGDATPLAAPSNRDMERAQAIGWAVRTAARYAPGDNSCLVQVLAARDLLQEAGIAGTVFIGAGQDAGESNAGFAAHAWLKCGDAFVTGEAGHERYAVIAVVSW